ncbi:hypothetical protein Mterra_02214 [Calidithermus terrae]|uniref:Uncharacterized protein n=1 Tax=Calidithermus terrae TaxID=1408545 RepID=A0A399EG82_9DEIN|nr:hypothetical protein [Calidithermus terrae]RIH83674.1 hypothetical protein Mterra_02214 [Calidithermus terrae]
MNALKVVTLWVRPPEEHALPEARETLEALLAEFYASYPEYEGSVAFSQSPRWPRYAFVYAQAGCTGLLPEAGRYLRRLLEHAFQGSEVRAYGRPWPLERE